MIFKDLEIGQRFYEWNGSILWEKSSLVGAKSGDGSEVSFELDAHVVPVGIYYPEPSIDPTVKAQGPTAAQKHDQGKRRYDLVPATLEREVAKVMTFGAAKYGDLNWTHGLAYNRLYAAVRRHLDAWWAGEDQDPESGLPHLAHAAATIGMLLGLQGREDLDNRKGYCL